MVAIACGSACPGTGVAGRVEGMTKARDSSEAEALGSRLKARREELGLSQEAAAHKIGVSVGTLSKYERGAMGMTVQAFREVALAYGMSPSTALGLEPDDEPLFVEVAAPTIRVRARVRSVDRSIAYEGAAFDRDDEL